MGRRRQPEKITLTVKGEPSAAAMPVENRLESAVHGGDTEVARW